MSHYPTPDELSEADAEYLLALTEDDLRVEIRSQFTDDQEQCLDIEINGVKLCLMWMGGYQAAAFHFTRDSAKARAVALEVLRENIAFWRERDPDED
jgi:hypothetical protein